LGRVYIETGWDKSSEVYKNLITKGLDMDGTMIKGFRSLPMDANVKLVTIDRLPLHDPFVLIDQLERRFRSFGQLLDFGLIKDGQCHVGEVYVVLNIPTDTVEQQVEKLEHVVAWIDNKPQIHLKWSGMPTYYRYCNKDGHCRANCEELLMTKLCFQCNERGHLIKHCPRLDSANKKVTNQKTTIIQQPANKKRFVEKDRRREKAQSKVLGKEREVVVIKDDDKSKETEDANKPKVAGIVIESKEDEQVTKPKESGSDKPKETDGAEPKDMTLYQPHHHSHNRISQKR
jgi:hypothetical protein